MIEFRQGDILNADVDALVNTVNCVGIMGRGVALQFRNAFPDNFEAYKAACQRREVLPGKMFVFRTGYLTRPHFIINFPTKRHWQGKSRIEDIEAGLRALATEVRRLGIRSIAIPPLGSGLGGLEWPQVRPLIEDMLRQLKDVNAIVYEPHSPRHRSKLVRATQVPAMTAGRAALIVLLDRYLAGLMDPFVSLLELHKLMYFMQVSGEALRLNYVKAHYGPYSENLRQVLTRIEGYFVTGYGDGADDPSKLISLVPGAKQDAERFLETHEQTRARFDRVADLVRGFETPFGMELLATVHWVASREGANTLESAIAMTHAWNERKRQFFREHIQVAWSALSSGNWLSPQIAKH